MKKHVGKIKKKLQIKSRNFFREKSFKKKEKQGKIKKRRNKKR